MLSLILKKNTHRVQEKKEKQKISFLFFFFHFWFSPNPKLPRQRNCLQIQRRYLALAWWAFCSMKISRKEERKIKDI